MLRQKTDYLLWDTILPLSTNTLSGSSNRVLQWNAIYTRTPNMLWLVIWILLGFAFRPAPSAIVDEDRCVSGEHIVRCGIFSLSRSLTYVFMAFHLAFRGWRLLAASKLASALR